MAAEFIAVADRNQSAVVDDADAVGHFLGNAQLMRGHQTVMPWAERSFSTSFTTRACCGSRPTIGSSITNDLRVVQQRGHDGHALARAVRKAFERLIHKFIQMKTRDQFLHVRLDSVSSIWNNCPVKRKNSQAVNLS